MCRYPHCFKNKPALMSVSSNEAVTEGWTRHSWGIKAEYYVYVSYLESSFLLQCKWWNYIDWFLNVKLTLNSWSVLLLDPVC